jgi:hypothetical protein
MLALGEVSSTAAAAAGTAAAAAAARYVGTGVWKQRDVRACRIIKQDSIVGSSSDKMLLTSTVVHLEVMHPAARGG